PAGGVAADGFADDRLRVAFGVGVRGVDEVSAATEKTSENSCRFSGRRSPTPVLAERHRAEAERADTQAGTSKGDVVCERHRKSSLANLEPERRCRCGDVFRDFVE